jgi:4-aminobutyrate aminotransferase-like enzyme
LSGYKVLELLQRDDFALIKQVNILGNNLKKQLEQTKERFPLLIKEVRGKGFLLGVEFTFPRQTLSSAHFLLGVMAEQELLVSALI